MVAHNFMPSLFNAKCINAIKCTSNIQSEPSTFWLLNWLLLLFLMNTDVDWLQPFRCCQALQLTHTMSHHLHHGPPQHSPLRRVNTRTHTHTHSIVECNELNLGNSISWLVINTIAFFDVSPFHHFPSTIRRDKVHQFIATNENDDDDVLPLPFLPLAFWNDIRIVRARWGWNYFRAVFSLSSLRTTKLVFPNI